MFGLSPIRLYAYLAVFLVIAGLAGTCKYLNHRLEAKAATIANLVTERTQLRANLEKTKANMAASLLERQKLQQGLTDIARRFSNIEVPSPKTLVKYVEKPGEACPRVSVSSDFVRVYNDASNP